MARPQRKHYTWDDYVKLPDDGNRYEIIDGVLHVTPSPIVVHQSVSAQLFLLLHAWAKSGPAGLVLYAPVDVVLAEDTVVVPDLIWISTERVREIVGNRVTGIPQLLIEIASPSTARRDRTVKADLYARHGADEYWLVDPKERTVEIRKRVGASFERHALGSGRDVLRSAIDPALCVVPESLFLEFGK